MYMQIGWTSFLLPGSHAYTGMGYLGLGNFCYKNTMAATKINLTKMHVHRYGKGLFQNLSYESFITRRFGTLATLQVLQCV